MSDLKPCPHDAIARAICREKCAFYGEPPCWTIGEWPNVYCDEPGCEALAIAAWNTRAPDLAAMRAGYDLAAAEAREMGVWLRRFDLAVKDKGEG